jgi:hypothetical protein
MLKQNSQIIKILICTQISLINFENSRGQDSSFTRTQLFSAGFIDVMNSGQTNSGAKVLRLNIGEPQVFCVPLSLYCGVSNNTVQNSSSPALKSNEHLITQYINPLSGLLNVALEDILFRPKSNSNTKFGFSYQLGERLLTGIRIDSINKQPVYTTINFLNTYLGIGPYFQTQAWERDKPSKIGVFWIASRIHWTRTGINQLHNFIPTLQSNGIYTGYSLGFGVYISKAVDVKVI